MKPMSKAISTLVCGLALGLVASVSAAGQGKKPNILVIMGDDIGVWNILSLIHISEPTRPY